MLLPRPAESQGSPLDPGFGEDGTVRLGFGRSAFQETEALHVLEDGSFLVLSLIYAGHHPAFGLSRFLPNGELDPTFGDGGSVHAWFPIEDDTIAADLAVLPDGSIIVGGWIILIEGVLIRFDADGQRDMAFGTDGVAYVDLQSLNDIAAQSDGGIVVVGTKTDQGVVARRYDPQGRLDGSFGTGGEITVPSEHPEFFSQRPLLDVDGEDRLVVVSGLRDGAGFEVARLTPDGLPDLSFGDDGVARLTVVDQTMTPREVVLQSDGGIAVGGTMYVNATNLVVFAARFLPDGQLDPQFSGDGLAKIDTSSESEGARSLASQPDGRLVLAGYTVHGGQFRHLLVRLLPNGQPDPSFGNQGIAVGPPGLFVEALALLPNGKLLTAGSTSDHKIALSRHVANGALDPSFGVPPPSARTPGVVIVGGIGPGNDTALDSWRQDDDRILVVGRSETAEACGVCVHVMRFEPEGTVDTSYGNGGVAQVPEFGWEASSLMLPDERLVLVGYHATGLGLVRLTDTGARDASFGTNGFHVVPLPFAGQFLPTTLTNEADGDLLIVGTYSPGSTILDRQFAALRIRADGSLDTAFGTGGLASVDVGTSNELPTAVVGFDDGRFVLGGSSRSTRWSAVMIGFNADGTLLTDFGTDGIATAVLTDDTFLQRLILHDGHLLALGHGWGSNFDPGELLLFRFDASGVFDGAFGWRRFFRGTGLARSTALTVQDDGRILLAGWKEAPGSEYDLDFAIARALPNGAPDPTFGVEGEVSTSFGMEDDGAFGIHVQASGRIVAVGTAGDGFDTDYALAGYLAVTPTSVDPAGPESPTLSTLSPAFPNPSAISTSFTFTTRQTQHVRAVLLDVLGREVAVVFDGEVQANRATPLRVSTSRLSGGTYLLRVEGEIDSAVRRLTVLH